jgi:hypothetical protein
LICAYIVLKNTYSPSPVTESAKAAEGMKQEKEESAKEKGEQRKMEEKWKKNGKPKVNAKVAKIK